jgi:hypothetical protein
MEDDKRRRAGDRADEEMPAGESRAEEQPGDARTEDREPVADGTGTGTESEVHEASPVDTSSQGIARLLGVDPDDPRVRTRAEDEDEREEE